MIREPDEFWEHVDFREMRSLRPTSEDHAFITGNRWDMPARTA